MYAVAATHLGIVLRCLFEDDRQSRATQASAISCLEALDSVSQCPESDLTSGVANHSYLGDAFGDMLSGMMVLLSVNVSYIIRRHPWKADDLVVLIRLR